MGAQHFASFFSNLFRICAWIFLRVIPARPGRYALPGLYFVYAIFALFSGGEPAVTVPTDKSQDEKTNGDAIHDIDETTSSKPKRGLLSTLLFSLPSSSRTHRRINLALNTLLLHCAFELMVYPVIDDASDVIFTRVGAVYSDAVKITVRHPFANTTEGVVQVVWRQAAAALSTETDGWTDGPVVTLSNESDWTSTIKLSGLWPSTSYEYRLADISKYMLPVPAQPIPFRTFPDPRIPAGNHFRFIVSSCTTPNFPYAPMKGRRIKGYDMLAEYLWPTSPVDKPIPAEVLEIEDILLGKDIPEPAPQTAHVVVDDEAVSSAATEVKAQVPLTPNTNKLEESLGIETAPAVAPPPADFMMFLGDFVYADVPVWWGDDREAYRRLYRRNYNSPSFRKIYEKLPIFHIYDDHEIINDFAGLGNDTVPYQNASDAYSIYNSLPNYDSIRPHQHYYEFQYGDVAFFVMDTRRYRSDVSSEDVHPPSMLGETQLADLHHWLAKVNTTTTFKFIISSVPFTSLWTYGTNDTWGGFMAERDALLDAFHTVPNVVVLSGDRHESAVIEFNAPEATGHRVFEVSSSPLSMFYIPFVHTMVPQSNATVGRASTHIHVDDEGVEHVVEVVEDIPKENVLNYTPVGNYKWSSIEVDTRNLDRPVAKVEMISDGTVVYKFEIAGTPVKLRTTSALGAFVPQGVTDTLDKYGLNPIKWFQRQ